MPNIPENTALVRGMETPTIANLTKLKRFSSQEPGRSVGRISILDFLPAPTPDSNSNNSYSFGASDHWRIDYPFHFFVLDPIHHPGLFSGVTAMLDGVRYLAFWPSIVGLNIVSKVIGENNVEIKF